MKPVLLILALAALLSVFVLPLIYLFGGIGLSMLQTGLLLATVVWFVAAGLTWRTTGG